MKINNQLNVGGPQKPSQQTPVEPGRPDRPDPSSRSGDSSHVSTLAKQIAKARRVADQLPDVRTNLVERARARLAGGFYDSDSVKDAVAEHLIDQVRESSG